MKENLESKWNISCTKKIKNKKKSKKKKLLNWIAKYYLAPQKHHFFKI